MTQRDVLALTIGRLQIDVIEAGAKIVQLEDEVARLIAERDAITDEVVEGDAE